MSLTTDEVRTIAFRLVRRGYDVEEVDAFLDRVEHALGEHEQRSPAAPGPRADVAPGPGGAGDAAEAPPASDATVRGLRVLELAERTAEGLLAEARAESEELLRSADVAAQQQRADAEAHAAELLQTARQRADELLVSARAEAHAAEAALQERSEREGGELERRLRELRGEVRALEELEAAHRHRLVTLYTEQLDLVQREPLRSVRGVAG